MEIDRLRRDSGKMKNDQIKIVLDTNFLLIPETKKIDIFKKIKEKKPKSKFIILKSVEKELQKMKTRESKIALQIIKQKKLQTHEVETNKKHTDDIIIEYAEKENAEVATNDKELKKRCINKKIPIIYLRSGKKIETKK